jgi:hypothetical protein
MTDQEYVDMNDKIKSKLASFYDFGTVSYQQILALKRSVSHIFNSINQYNNPTLYTQPNWDSSIDSIIYLSMIKTAIKSKHQRYLNYDLELIN